MITIQGIGGVPEPAGPKQTQNRDKTPPADVSTAEDGVSISSEASQAATAGDIVRQSGQQNEVRQAKIEQAKQNLEEGTYKVQEVVLQVAARLSQYLSA
jgi:anti-sigma28 factor (negative regulator of flagellin synthesis)